MLEIKHYWLEELPTIKDVEEAFKIVAEQQVVVQLNWFVRYSGTHKATIKPKYLGEMTAQEYFDNCIPHEYGM